MLKLKKRKHSFAQQLLSRILFIYFLQKGMVEVERLYPGQKLPQKFMANL